VVRVVESPIDGQCSGSVRRRTVSLMDLQMTWQPSLLSQKRKTGPPIGLRNLGNSCYLNSVLQCLTYTPPLANFCLTLQHSSLCNRLFNSRYSFNFSLISVPWPNFCVPFRISIQVISLRLRVRSAYWRSRLRVHLNWISRTTRLPRSRAVSGSSPSTSAVAARKTHTSSSGT